MAPLLHIAERVINRPLLIHRDKIPLVLSVLGGRVPLGDISEIVGPAEARISELPQEAQLVLRGPTPETSRFAGERRLDQNYNPVYRLVDGGVAIVSIVGSLVNRGAWVGASSGLVSYEGIKHQVAMALQDPDVKSILLDIHSAGGEAIGAMEAAEAIRQAADTKPVTAVVNGMAASAGYALASGASRIVTTPSAVSGSIGVVLLHLDFSRQLDQEGVTPTLIFVGDHKVDGNPFEPLPDSVRSDLQRESMQYYDLFVSQVAAGRSSLTPDAIRATQARIFIGEEAVAAGLADSVGTFEEALADLARGTGGRIISSNQKGIGMSTENGAPAAEAGNEPKTTTPAAAPQAAPAAPSPSAEDVKGRIKMILDLDEAQGREKQAKAIAFDTDMSVEQAKAILAAGPKGEQSHAERKASAANESFADLGAPSATAPGGTVVSLADRMKQTHGAKAPGAA